MDARAWIARGPLARKVNESMQESSQRTAHLFETMNGLDTVKAIGAEAWSRRKWENLTQAIAHNNLETREITSRVNYANAAVLAIAEEGSVARGASRCHCGQCSHHRESGTCCGARTLGVSCRPMWRALILGLAAWIASASASFSCEDHDNIQGILYDTVPPNTSPSAIILDVVFEPEVRAQWRGGPIEARVRRVVQGDFTGDHVRVGIMNDSCLYPFVFGAEGLIIGRMREGFEVLTLQGRSYPSGEQTMSEVRLGFDGSWFQPIQESIRERRERTDAN